MKQEGNVNAVNAIYQAENNGVPIIFVTGNVMCAAKTIAILLGTTDGLLAENGGVIESHIRSNNFESSYRKNDA
jgi:hydroxymethylpyrimidine pyrophosphatase-like HAD family hydrolase